MNYKFKKFPIQTHQFLQCFFSVLFCFIIIFTFESLNSFFFTSKLLTNERAKGSVLKEELNRKEIIYVSNSDLFLLELYSLIHISFSDECIKLRPYKKHTGRHRLTQVDIF